MIRKEIDRIQGSENAIAAFRAGMKSLFDAGIIDAIRVLGRPKRIKNGQSHIEMASEGAWSAGWNDCLDTLLYFEETYLQPTTTTPELRMDFGSLTRAVETGEITQEEADAIRQGNVPRYDAKQYTRNIPKPAAPDKQ